MMREIVSLKANEKNLLHMEDGLSRVQARINQPLGFLVVKPGLLGFTICA